MEKTSLLKYILTLCFLFGFLSIKAQDNQTPSREQPVTCSYIDAGTLSCYSPNVDTDNDGSIDEDEWTNAEVDSRGIIDLNNTRRERELSTGDRWNNTEGLYEEEGLYNNNDIIMEPYREEEIYNYEGLKERERELDNRQDQMNQSFDYDIYQPQQPGEFQ
ncbi:MAG TPA: hypothetical protein VIK89_03395 [Cytophagaceae bacterium]